MKSNNAFGTGNVRTNLFNGEKPNSAAGGGLYVNGASNVTISDSTLSNNSAKGGQGVNENPLTGVVYAGGGGSASGGGLYVTGSGWNVTLTGDTLSGNSAVGGNGGNGQAGGDYVRPNTSGGNGGDGGFGGQADGGAAYFNVKGSSGTGSLTILNDSTNPSIMIDNSVQGGNGGNGGAGGASNGTASNSNGGWGGSNSVVEGGALYVASNSSGYPQVMIGNTAFYGNTLNGGTAGKGGAAGTGGLGAAGQTGLDGYAAVSQGGAVSIEPSNFTMVNCTVAKNTGTGGAGVNYEGTEQNLLLGSGIYIGSYNVILANNTITQNTNGNGVYVYDGNPILVNNLMQGNTYNGAETDLGNYIENSLSALNYNFIGNTGYSSTTNIVGNTQPQLGNVAGVDASGNPTGGPIYYPLLPNVVSIDWGTTAILDTIASVEGTTAANTTDEIGNPRSTNGLIDIGAVQSQNPITPSAPVITVNPTDQSVYSGGTVSFTASASGAPTPIIHWQVSFDGGKTFSNTNGATSSTALC